MARDLPEKKYFKIGEVADLVGVKPHVLRYWESEFTCLKPVKSRSKQRLFRREDIETAKQIKELLYDQGLTISGAQKLLKKRSSKSTAQPQLIHNATDMRQLLRAMRTEITSLRDSIPASRAAKKINQVEK
ncbi:MAG: MerR family transcriptional regulator [Desulfuromonas sp.]|nr:MAG: MerR family transcriptional regulator [Desulfuromonas sp.]